MRSAIFSIVTGVVLTLLLRGPAPPPCPAHAAAVDTPIVADLHELGENSRYEKHPERQTTLRHLPDYTPTTPATSTTCNRTRSLYSDTYRCHAHSPGPFFTHHGEALDFRGASPTYRNMTFNRRPQ